MTTAFFVLLILVIQPVFLQQSLQHAWLVLKSRQLLKKRLAVGQQIHATLYASHRQLAPILSTPRTTIAGLFSLAIGWGGKSLLRGGAAVSSIVWGLPVGATGAFCRKFVRPPRGNCPFNKQEP